MKRHLLNLTIFLALSPVAATASEFLSLDPPSNSDETTWIPGPDESLYEFRPEFETVIRGQSPQTYDLGPGAGQPGMMYDPNNPYFGSTPQGGYPPAGIPQGTMPQGTMPQGAMPPGTMPQGGTIYSSPYGTPGADPFLSPAPGMAPGGAMMPAPYPMVTGVNGPQPARLGWSTRWDFAYVFPADLADGGEVNAFEVDWAADYVKQGPNGWLWTLTPQIDYRQYDFKSPGAPILGGGVSDNYYRFGYRFQTTSPMQGPLSYRFGFTPAVATDFQKHLNSQAWNFDVDATLYYRSSPNWMWVAGVLYWERAEDYVLPHAGVVWNPNQFWEIRAVYPNPRADVFIGTPFGIATWLYAGAEYSIESFQAGEIDAYKAQLQVEEWRAFAGVRWETCTFSSYFDVGYAFERDWDVHSGLGVSNLSPEDALMLRFGVRY